MTQDITIITFLLSLTISLLLMLPFIKLMEKNRILDKAGGRKIHTGYTAHMGGIVIFIAFALSVSAMLFRYNMIIDIAKTLYICVIIFIMLIVGARDDMHNISALNKLIVEIIIGFFMSYVGIRLTSLNGFLGIYEIPSLLSYFLTTCFFIVVVNAYNLIDGIDGQAGMQAINVFIFCWLFFLVIVGDKVVDIKVINPLFLYICIVAILGAIIGFLRYNWQKAQIFMGDTGSLFIGTLITIFITLSIKYAMLCNTTDLQNNTNEYTLFGYHLKATIAPFLALFYLPMADTLRVFIGRRRKGKSAFHPDKTHIHHLFVRIGYSHQKCTLLTTAISLVISIIGVTLAFFFNDNICIFLIIASWFLYVCLLKYIIKRNMILLGGGKI